MEWNVIVICHLLKWLIRYVITTYTDNFGRLTPADYTLNWWIIRNYGIMKTHHTSQFLGRSGANYIDVIDSRTTAKYLQVRSLTYTSDNLLSRFSTTVNTPSERTHV